MTIAVDWPKPPTILEHFQRSLEALGALASHVRVAATPESRFYLMTQEEVDFAIAEMSRELNQEVVLLLTASFEAEFQTDFHDRVSRKRKDRVSKEFRRILGDQRGRRQGAKRATFEEILDVWAKQQGHVRAIGNLKQLIRFRHWLAHGRYWVQKSGLPDPDPFDAWQRGKIVLRALLGIDL